jgi:hypothetical protein
MISNTEEEKNMIDNVHTTPEGPSWFPWMVKTGKPML